MTQFSQRSKVTSRFLLAIAAVHCVIGIIYSIFYSHRADFGWHDVLYSSLGIFYFGLAIVALWKPDISLFVSFILFLYSTLHISFLRTHDAFLWDGRCFSVVIYLLFAWAFLTELRLKQTDSECGDPMLWPIVLVALLLFGITGSITIAFFATYDLNLKLALLSSAAELSVPISDKLASDIKSDMRNSLLLSCVTCCICTTCVLLMSRVARKPPNAGNQSAGQI
jgi:hypothetical protein